MIVVDEFVIEGGAAIVQPLSPAAMDPGFQAKGPLMSLCFINGPFIDYSVGICAWCSL